MKSALTHLEDQFESLLDRYCLAVESGQLDQAEKVSAEAEDYLEAIGVLKFSRFLDEWTSTVRV